MNLYVWDDVLADYTPGMICAVASSEVGARAKIAGVQETRRKQGHLVPDMLKEIAGKAPEVLPARDAVAFCYGGG